MPQIILRENESFEGALRRFKKLVDKCGIVVALKERMKGYVPNSQKRKVARKKAQKMSRIAELARLYPKQYRTSNRLSKSSTRITKKV